jgi:hypothetical protein
MQQPDVHAVQPGLTQLQVPVTTPAHSRCLSQHLRILHREHHPLLGVVKAADISPTLH